MHLNGPRKESRMNVAIVRPSQLLGNIEHARHCTMKRIRREAAWCTVAGFGYRQIFFLLNIKSSL